MSGTSAIHARYREATDSFSREGVYENGEAPSGLIFPTDQGMRYWEERKKPT